MMIGELFPMVAELERRVEVAGSDTHELSGLAFSDLCVVLSKAVSNVSCSDVYLEPVSPTRGGHQIYLPPSFALIYLCRTF